jgi:5'-deoxynucleotidase YfbR-like HD superfamily hydrolase
MEHKLRRDKKHIQTASGVKFYPFKPSSLDVVLEDGAQALSLQCRYSGHTKWKGKMKHYSVAQHSLYVSYICKYPLWGLLHDLTEAYCVDVPTPIKKRVPKFKEMEDKIERAIAIRFNLEWPRPPEVKEADIYAFNLEWALLMGVDKRTKFYKQAIKDKVFLDILNYSMEETKNAFINRYEELTS